MTSPGSTPDGGLPADVLVRRGLGAERITGLTEVFAAAGVQARVLEAPVRRGEALTWLALAVLPLSGFFSSLGASLAQDAYVGLSRMVRGLLGPDPGTVVLEDRDSGVRVVLDDGLPEEAYRALLRLDLSQLPTGTTVTYDTTAGWVHHNGP